MDPSDEVQEVGGGGRNPRSWTVGSQDPFPPPPPVTAKHHSAHPWGPQDLPLRAAQIPLGWRQGKAGTWTPEEESHQQTRIKNIISRNYLK